ncbi:chitin synthase [Gigaspora margarita]|uniref:Chitin synthase n=1 Tax=Gigaspora margarita TaxID=4874 RepID=A0A8H4ACL1_GIGMA|nr:chitin synthase [Gigaspora margarita]
MLIGRRNYIIQHSLPNNGEYCLSLFSQRVPGMDGFEKSKVKNKTVKAHIYEYTTPISINCSRDSVDKEAIIPTQILFCLQEKNKEKIDSHRWSFNAFCPILNPDFSAYQYSALLDSTNNTEESSNNNIRINNDYLAKNNVIWFELISNRYFSWLLHYESSSQAELDLPEKFIRNNQQHLCNLNGYFHTCCCATSHFIIFGEVSILFCTV